MNHISNYSQKKARSSRQKRLEYAGFLFKKNDEGLWVVLIPITSQYSEALKLDGEPPNVRLNKAYKYLGTAINAAEREIRNWRTRRNASGDLSMEAIAALELYDRYKPNFEDIW